MKEIKPEILIEIAKLDLEASRVLSDKQLHPQSLFYLQQAIEKTVKYLGLSNNYITAKEVSTSIGHKTTKVFRQLILQYDNQSVQEIDLELNIAHQEIQKTQDNDLVESIINQISEFRKTRPQIPDLNSIEAILEILENSPELYEFSSSEISSVKKLMENPSTKSMLESKRKDFFENFEHKVQSLQVLFLLSIYFEKLVSKVRYPMLENFVNPSVTYNKKHPLVKNITFFQDECAQCILDLK